MNKLVIITILILYSFTIKSQNSDEIFQYVGHKGFNIESEKIDSLQLLPDKIQMLVSDFIKTRFNGYDSKIKFVHAQIFHIDSILNNNLSDLKQRNTAVFPIPYYDLNYSFCDSALGIIQYWINISMDKYGQVFHCNFPYLEYPRIVINSNQTAKNFSDSLMTVFHPNINTSNYKINLIYNEDEDQLNWQICYLIKKEDTTKDYHFMQINAHINYLVTEGNFVELHHF